MRAWTWRPPTHRTQSVVVLRSEMRPRSSFNGSWIIMALRGTHGIRAPPVRVRHKRAMRTHADMPLRPEYGMGVIATHDLQPGDDVMVVPAHAVLCIGAVLRSDFGRALLAARTLDRSAIKAKHVMCAYMMHGRAEPDNAWHAYLRSLPTAYDLTVLWEAEELQLLLGTNVPAETARREEELRRAYCAMFPALLNEFPELFGHPELYTWWVTWCTAAAAACMR